MKKMNKKGFTIVELVIVIAVIAILAGVMIPTFSGIVEKAEMSNVKSAAAALYKEAYAIDYSDGVLDGADATSNVTIEEQMEASEASVGGTFTYEYTPAAGETPASWNITYVKDEYTATYANGAWTVGKTPVDPE